MTEANRSADQDALATDTALLREINRLRQEIERLRAALEKAADTLHDLGRGLHLLGRPLLVQACEVAEKASREALGGEPVAAVERPSAAPYDPCAPRTDERERMGWWPREAVETGGKRAEIEDLRSQVESLQSRWAPRPLSSFDGDALAAEIDCGQWIPPLAAHTCPPPTRAPDPLTADAVRLIVREELERALGKLAERRVGVRI